MVQLSLMLVVIVGVLCFVFRNHVPTHESKYPKGRKTATDTTLMRNGAIPNLAEAESFPFDPNTADSTQLRRLGLSQFQIQNIYKYRAKGGAYHRPEQFKKLYGMTVAQWRHLQPLIRIGEEYQYLADTDEAYNPSTDGYPQQNHTAQRTYGHPNKTNAGEGEYEEGHNSRSYNGAYRDTTLYPHKLKAGETINLNTADTTALKRIPGIGSYFARKIVQYREKLGGFTSLAQLEDMENIPLGIESYLTLGQATPRKIRINHATLRELNAHPYLSYYQARVIANHIHQFGPIRNFQALSLYEEFTEKDFKRLAPYVDFTE